MGIGSLVLFCVVCITSQHCDNLERSELAQSFAQKAAETENLPQLRSERLFGQEKKEVIAFGNLEKPGPSRLGSSLSRSGPSSNLQHDLVLQTMQTEQSTHGPALQTLQFALEQGVDTKVQIKKPKSTKEGSPKEEGIMLPEQVPWVMSTPQTRLATKRTDLKAAAEPAQQHLETPQVTGDSKAVMTQEEHKLLDHLKALVEMKIEPSEALQSQYDALVQKEKEIQASKALTHGHVHRVNRLKEQAEAAGRKIRALDIEWQGFMKATQEKIAAHAKLYQSCRAEHMEMYNKKKEEWQKAKQAAHSATQALLEAKTEIEVTEVVDVEEQVAQMNSEMVQAGLVYQISDEEEVEDMDTSQQGGEPNPDKPSRRATFKSSTSPHRVANQFLKKTK